MMKNKMYFLPLLLGSVSYLVYPSVLLALFVTAFLFGYFFFGGETLKKGEYATIRGQLSFRMLSVKLLSMNGQMSDNTYEVHSLLTPDQPETSELRTKIRNAAFTCGYDWQYWAKRLKTHYGHDPLMLLERYKHLFTQLRAGTEGITYETQDRLIEIGKMWGIGPQHAREFLTDMQTAPSPNMAAW